MRGNHGGVARELLIRPETVGRKMDERVEPVGAARDFDHGIHDRVAREAMDLFVRQNQRALLCVEARLKIRRQHEPRAEHADERRADRRIGGETSRAHRRTDKQRHGSQKPEDGQSIGERGNGRRWYRRDRLDGLLRYRRRGCDRTGRLAGGLDDLG